MMGYRFATAATTLLGQQIGVDRLKETKQYAKLCLYLAISVMTLFGGVLFFAGEWAGSIFSEDPNVTNNIGTALKVSGVFQPFLAAVLILTGAFQGANNTKFPMYLTGIGMWAIRTLFVYLLGIKLGMGLMGVWIAIELDIGFRAIVLAIQFSRDKWIIQKVAPEEDPKAHCHPETTKDDLPACVNSY